MNNIVKDDTVSLKNGSANIHIGINLNIMIQTKDDTGVALMLSTKNSTPSRNVYAKFNAKCNKDPAFNDNSSSSSDFSGPPLLQLFYKQEERKKRIANALAMCNVLPVEPDSADLSGAKSVIANVTPVNSETKMAPVKKATRKQSPKFIKNNRDNYVATFNNKQRRFYS